MKGLVKGVFWGSSEIPEKTSRRLGIQTMKIALDTNVLIYFFEGIEPQAGKVEKILDTFMKGQNEGIISTITIA